MDYKLRSNCEEVRKRAYAWALMKKLEADKSGSKSFNPFDATGSEDVGEGYCQGCGGRELNGGAQDWGTGGGFGESVQWGQEGGG